MFGEGSNKLLLPTQSTCNVLCVCWMYACYKINMFKPNTYIGQRTGTIIRRVQCPRERNHCRTHTLAIGMKPLSDTYIVHRNGTIVEHVHCPRERNHCRTRTLSTGTEPLSDTYIDFRELCLLIRSPTN